jgi:hypothetical protein
MEHMTPARRRWSLAMGGTSAFLLAIGLSVFVVVPAVRLELLFRRAGEGGMSLDERTKILAELRILQPNLTRYLRVKAATADFDTLLRLYYILDTHPGLDRFDCRKIVDANIEGPDLKSQPEPEAEEILRLHLDLLTASLEEKNRRYLKLPAVALELVGLWTSAPRSLLAWTRLNLHYPPNNGVPNIEEIITTDELKDVLSLRRAELEKTVAELRRWFDEGKGRIVFGRFAIPSGCDRPRVLEPDHLSDPFIRAGFCRIDEQSPGLRAYAGRR